MAGSSLTPDPNAGSNLVPGGAISTAVNQQLPTPDLTTPSIEAPSVSTSTPSPAQTASADAGTVSSNAPVSDTAVSSTSQPTSIGRYNSINNNPFDKYINVTYGMSLAMVNKSSLNSLGDTMVSKEPNGSTDVPGMTSDNYIVFASTAESITDPNRPEYYNIKGLVFTSFLGHMPQNPMVLAIWDAKLKLFEPHGFSLREDLELMRRDLGYDEKTEPLNYVYRLEIWFSGWDPQTGAWVQRIPFPLNDNSDLTSVVYYLSITTIDAVVTTQGTEYQLVLQIYSHKAFRAESIIFRADTLTIGQITAKNEQTATAPQQEGVPYGQGDVTNFGNFCQLLGDKLAQQVQDDTECGTFEGLKITYKISMPSWLRTAEFDRSGVANLAHGSITYDATSGMFSYSGQDIDILMLLYNVMDAIPLVRKFLIRDDDHGFLEPAVMWNVRSNIKYTGETKDVINGFQDYEYDYYIEPVLTYRSRTTVPDYRNERAADENQRQRATNMYNFGMILRQYDFYFTNDNSEVLDLEFRFKNYYQEPFPARVHTLSGQTQQGNDTPWPPTQETVAAQSSQSPEYQITKPPSSGSSLSSVLGQPVNPQSASDYFASAAYKLQGMVRPPSPPQTKGVPLSEAQQEMALYQYSKQQYFRYDMIDVNMTVRFDPTWLLNPYCATGDFTSRLNTDATGSGGDQVLYLHMDRVVLLRANPPIQSDFMNPNRTSGASQNLDMLSGFYQVITAVNEFDGGKFTQKLNMFKYPHMNGFTTLGTDVPQSSVQNQDSIPVGPTTGAAPAQQTAGSLAPDPNTGLT